VIELSAEQRAVALDSPPVPLAVIACAGSGKTSTATHRVLELRRQLGSSRGHVALLSFSNVAVETFRRDYSRLLAEGQARRPGGVTIETADSFFTTYVLRPHAYRTMGCSKTPSLITGGEPFLQNEGFRFWATVNGRRMPVDVGSVRTSFFDGAATFCGSPGAGPAVLLRNGLDAAKRLGAIGAYTHDLGRFWAYCTLQDQPLIRRALTRRFPYILVDEAQDVGPMHQAILDVLAKEGAQVSLIGDPHQAIYEFAGADGKALKDYSGRAGVKQLSLTINYRSVPKIVQAANSLSGRADGPARAAPPARHGAYILSYPPNSEAQMVDSFRAAVADAGLEISRSAVVCRAKDLVGRLRGHASDHGQGVVRRFCLAAVLRDVQAEYAQAFDTVVGCFASLLSSSDAPEFLKVRNPCFYRESRLLRRRVWRFVRDSDSGLPSSGLVANREWHSNLVLRVKAFLQDVEKECGLRPTSNVGKRLAKKGLPSRALAGLPAPRPAGENVRIETVHHVKGESLDAVLYVATKAHVKALIGGVGTEDGRIGYVALTRARDLFWLAVPEGSYEDFKPALLAAGFDEWGEDAQSVRVL